MDLITIAYQMCNYGMPTFTDEIARDLKYSEYKQQIVSDLTKMAVINDLTFHSWRSYMVEVCGSLATWNAVGRDHLQETGNDNGVYTTGFTFVRMSYV